MKLSHTHFTDCDAIFMGLMVFLSLSLLREFATEVSGKEVPPETTCIQSDDTAFLATCPPLMTSLPCNFYRPDSIGFLHF